MPVSSRIIFWAEGFFFFKAEIRREVACLNIIIKENTSGVYHELIHAPWAERRPYCICYHLASIDVTDDLRSSLGGLSAFLQEDDLWLLWKQLEQKIEAY